MRLRGRRARKIERPGLQIAVAKQVVATAQIDSGDTARYSRSTSEKQTPLERGF